ncbi:galactosyltransferase-related protein [Nocardiopsis flavescens]|uniref:galactosyltransferase-related protein n=1 Tax=Nocardiopsis flavescens TaxID=758803 RepID=UPI003669F6CA
MTVAIPWRGGEPHRDAHHAYVRARLREMLPDAVHVDVDTPHACFHRAAARNAAVDRAGDGVMILCDADTIPEPEPLHTAIRGAAADGRLHLPYELFVGLSEKGTQQVHRGVPHRSAHVLETSARPTGGVLVLTRDAYRNAGGQDERFTGWGWEDTAFRRQADCLLGATVTHPGVIYHLWHPSDADLDHPTYHSNAALYQRYHRARSAPARMSTLTREWRTTP